MFFPLSKQESSKYDKNSATVKTKRSADDMAKYAANKAGMIQQIAQQQSYTILAKVAASFSCCSLQLKLWLRWDCYMNEVCLVLILCHHAYTPCLHNSLRDPFTPYKVN